MNPTPENGEQPVSLQVDPGARGLRADVYLASRLGRMSRSRIQAMFQRKRVLCGSRFLKASSRLQGHETLTLYKPSPGPERELPHVPILYRDDDLLVLDKPADLTMHPTAKTVTRTLTAFLSSLSGESFTPAHRLDRETSGIVACGRKGESSARLKAQFRNRDTCKIYLAVVQGSLTERLIVREPLGFSVDSPIRIKMGVRSDGDPSESWFHPVSVGKTHSLIACRPLTGRQHQLRAHLEWLGFPLAGDKLYGVSPDFFLEFIEKGWTARMQQELVFSRQLLHAATLRIRHPATGEELFFCCDPPDDFRKACLQLDLQCPDLVNDPLDFPY